MMAASVTAETPMEMKESDIVKLLGLDSPELLVLAKEVDELHKQLRKTSRHTPNSTYSAELRNTDLKSLRSKVRALRSLGLAIMGYKLEMIIVDCE
jgi:uncharacterized protein involved in exopolysaccharide biosynthesis